MVSPRERVRRGKPVLWVDYVAYAERLLAPGGVPWTDTAATVAWYRQAQGLIASDVIAIPLWRLIDALLVRAPRLVEQMRTKQRLTHPLRALLASEELRTSAVELVRALRSVFPGTLLAIVLPSPRTAMLLAHRASSRDSGDPETGEEEVDTAVLYLADFLRCFGEAGLDILLLDGGEPTDAGTFEAHRPVYNVAHHYGWVVGLETGPSSPAPVPNGGDFVVAHPANRDTADLVPVRVALASDAASEHAGFDFLHVPRDAVPENVLQSLQAIRSGAGR